MELSPLVFSLIPLLILSLVYLYHHHHRNQYSRKPQTTSILKPYPLLGTLPHFIRNRHRFLEWTAEILVQSPTHTITLTSPTNANGIITSDPRNVEHMLKTNFPNYPRGDRSLTLLHDFLGHGIFNSDGDQWKHLRKTASYEFNKRSLRNFVMDTVSHEIVDRLLPLMKRAAGKGNILELQDVLERFGFDNICKVSFGEDPACLSADGIDGAEAFMEAFGDSQIFVTERFMGAMDVTWKIKRLFNIGSEKKLRESVRIVHEYAMNIIRSRKNKLLEKQPATEQEEDLLSRFASSREANSDELLRDNVISFILAGRETTSTALTWFFWILTTRPDVEKRILDEIRSIRSRSKKPISETFSFDELREMDYLHAAISESLRLYPPVALDTQSCKDGDIMPDGTFVGKNWFVTYSAYAMGRMESIWGKDCLEFKPERWLENGAFRPESPFRFPAFHAGPRMCLGKEMAYIQMKSIVASVTERFQIEAADEKRVPQPLLQLTMKMKGGLEVKVRERVNLCVA